MAREKTLGRLSLPQANDTLSLLATRRGSQMVADRSVDPFEHSWNPPSPPHDLKLIIPFRLKVSCGKTLRYAAELFCGIALNLSEPKRG